MFSAPAHVQIPIFFLNSDNFEVITQGSLYFYIFLNNDISIMHLPERITLSNEKLFLSN